MAFLSKQTVIHLWERLALLYIGNYDHFLCWYLKVNVNNHSQAILLPEWGGVTYNRISDKKRKRWNSSIVKKGVSFQNKKNIQNNVYALMHHSKYSQDYTLMLMKPRFCLRLIKIEKVIQSKKQKDQAKLYLNCWWYTSCRVVMS